MLIVKNLSFPTESASTAGSNVMDKRHEHRIKLIQELFPLSFKGLSIKNIEDLDPTIKIIIENLSMLDTLIEKYAPRYPLSKIAKMDLAILRLSMYELLIEKKEPPKVIIDEAVRLSKEFGNEKSYAFINGVLGSALKGDMV